MIQATTGSNFSSRRVRLAPVHAAAAPAFEDLEVIMGNKTTADHNKQAMTKYLEEVWNDGQLEAAHSYIHDDFRAPRSPIGELPPGPAAIKQLVGMFKQAMPSLKYKIHDIFGEGDKVCVRVSAQGKHEKELFGHSPEATAQHERPVNGIIIARFKDGKIIEAWNQFDTISGRH
jgi:predicted ester cyclase